MMKCKQAAQLLSQSQDRNLTLDENVRLKFHLFMCSGCTHYNKQINFMRKAIEQFRER